VLYIFTRPLCQACQQLKRALFVAQQDYKEIPGTLLTGEETYSNVNFPVMDILTLVQATACDQLQDWPPTVPILVKDDCVAFGLEQALELVHDFPTVCPAHTTTP